jgi:AbrB family looped-hinge helix DNA binding protein
MKTYRVRVGVQGRIVIPEELRVSNELKEGTELLMWRDSDGNLRLGQPTEDVLVRVALASLPDDQRRAVESYFAAKGAA